MFAAVGAAPSWVASVTTETSKGAVQSRKLIQFWFKIFWYQNAPNFHFEIDFRFRAQYTPLTLVSIVAVSWLFRNPPQ